MAVTTQKSTEYTNRTATPLVTANAVADKGKLRTQSLYRARQKDIKLNAGTPHDWEDLEKYQEEINKE